MKNQFKVGIMAVCLMTTNLFAQTLQDAIKETTNEQYEKADASFKALIASSPNAETYFYYGENFFKSERYDKAKDAYQKGQTADATNPLPYVGLGKVEWFHKNLTGAKADFTKALELSKSKNSTVLMKISEVYIQFKDKDLPEAFALLEQAEKIDAQNPNVYILLGDAYLEQNDGTQAINNYEKAEELDKSSVTAVLRQGQLYNRARNYNLALDLYKKASGVDSTFAPAYREKAEIYARAGQYANAVDQYKRYLEINNDCGARGRYAGFLYQAKEYALSIEAAKEAQQCDPTNVYLYRYLAYSQYENKEYEDGLKNSDAFFAKVTPDIAIISLDYEYHAKLNSKLGNDSLAILDYEKAMAQDTSVDLIDDLATAYMKMKKYDKAAEAYETKVAEGKAGINDYYGLGRAYYYGKVFDKADTTFAQMIALRPELSLSYLWRAKASVQLDPTNELWLAKPYYEAFIEKTTPEELERNKQNLVGAHTYLAAYYASQKDLENTKKEFQAVLDLDPENAQAKKFLEAAH